MLKWLGSTGKAESGREKIGVAARALIGTVAPLTEGFVKDGNGSNGTEWKR